MARIRTIKPSFFASGTLARCSLQARLLFVGLLTEADDEGKLIGSAKRISGNLFPHDYGITDSKVGRWLTELQDVGCIIRYAVAGVEYILLPNFLKHQKISHPTPSILPNPSGISPETFRPEVEVEVEVEREVEVEEEQGEDQIPAQAPLKVLDRINTGLLESLWHQHIGWERSLTVGLVVGLAQGSDKKRLPACGPRAVNAAIDDLYANASSVSDPAGYLRQRAEAHSQSDSRKEVRT